MGCGGGCGGSTKSKSGGYTSKPMKGWGMMKSNKTSSSSGRKMTGGGGYGRPAVKLSFGGKKR